MKNERLNKREQVFQIILRNREAFNRILMRVFSDKPTYRRSFLEKQNGMYDLIQSFPNIALRLEEESFGTIENWLERSEKDLEVCKRSFDSGDTENSIYNLQQSLEKLAKSYALYFGLFTECDLRPEVGHLPVKIYIKLLEEEWISKATGFFGLKSDPLHDLKVLKPFSRMTPEARQEILNMDRDIPFFLKLNKNITRSLRKSTSERETRELINMMKPYGNIKNFFQVMFEFASVVMPLSVITSVHESLTRYPDELRKSGIVYKETQIVKNLQEIMNLLKDNMKRFRDLIRDNKEKAINWENADLGQMEAEIKRLSGGM